MSLVKMCIQKQGNVIGTGCREQADKVQELEAEVMDATSFHEY